MTPSAYLLTAAFLTGQLLFAQDQIRYDHQLVLDQLNAKHSTGDPIELDDPRIPELVQKGWALAGAWAADWLDRHPLATDADLRRLFDGFAPPPNGGEYAFLGSAVRVGPSVYVVEASYGVDFQTGTFMVVALNESRRFQALWNIKDLAARHFPQRDEIGRWMHLVRRAYYNGPLTVDKVLRLSLAVNGNPRFLVDALQCADGGTQLAQLSIWQWDGAEAKPLLVDTYEYTFASRGFRFDGRTLRISTKERPASFFACGGCPEPRGVWKLRITPGSVQDLGHHLVEPEPVCETQ